MGAYDDAGFIFGLSLFLFGFFGLINKLFYIRRIVRGEGIVLEIYSTSSGEESGLSANVEFEHEGNMILFETTIPSDAYIVGSAIAVMYDPKKPDNAAYGSVKQLFSLELGLFFGGLMVCFFMFDSGVEIWKRYVDYLGPLFSR